MSRNKELWDKAIEGIDDKYIEETARTIIKKAGTPIDMNSIAPTESGNIQTAPKKKESRLGRTLPVLLASAAAVAMIVGAGYILDKYDISMVSTHDGEAQTTTTTNTTPDVAVPLTVKDELYKLKWGMTIDEVKDCLSFNPTNINTSTISTLEYKNLFFEGYPSKLEIVVHNDKGLYEIRYRIEEGKAEDVFNALISRFNETNGIYDPINKTLIRWHFDAEDYSISLSNTGEEVICSKIPLIPVEERYYTYLQEQEQAKRPDYSWLYIKADKIDQYADPQEIVLEKSEELSRLSGDYLHYVEENLAYELGEPVEGEGIHDTYEIISEEIKTYEDFKNLFTDSVYGEYFDYINTGAPRISEIDGKLCYTELMGGYLGIVESWFIGYDWYTDKIVGHFAVLEGIEDTPYNNAEYLNDLNNYSFYDIVIQNVDGKYVITDCYNTETGNNEISYQTHGYFYNSGMVDRSLITNEKVKPADDKIITSVVSLDDNKKITLSGKYGEKGMKLQLRQYNVTVLDEFNTEIYPYSEGEIQPELYTLDMTSGELIYLGVPHKENGKNTFTITLYGVVDGKIKQFTDLSGEPLVINSEFNALCNIASSDIIYAGKVIGEPREFYVLNFYSETPEASEFSLCPDMDTNMELVAYSSLEFTEFNENEEYKFQGDWRVIFNGTGFAEEGETFNFETANNTAETDEAWYFTDLENGMRGGSGAELYVIFKDNPDVMYFYQEPLYTPDAAFCNYDMVFERTELLLGRYSARTFDDFEFIATLEPEQNIRFITKDIESEKTILDFDTGINANKVSYTDEYGSGEASDSDICDMRFVGKNVIMLYVPESRDKHRIYFYHVQKDKITQFTNESGMPFTLISDYTSYDYTGYRKVYEYANAFTLTDNILTTGDVQEYYLINFDSHIISKGQLFPADTDTSLINYESLVFDESYSEKYDNPFATNWKGAYTESVSELYIFENPPVAETEKAWYCRYEYDGMAELLCMYKNDIDYMYSYPLVSTYNHITGRYVYYTSRDYAHSDYSTVYKKTSAAAKIYGAEDTYRYYLDKDYTLALFNDKTLKLKICDYNSGMVNTEYNTGIVTSSKTLKINGYRMGSEPGEIIVMSVPESGKCKNYLFIATKDSIKPFTASSGEQLIFEGFDLDFYTDSNLNEFFIAGAYDKERTYYKVNFADCTYSERQIYPIDSDKSSLNIAEITKGETDIPESDPFFGKWDADYGHWMPFNVIFDTEGVRCYETDKFWCMASADNGGEGVIYVIMKDNPDYMYMYPHIIGPDYRLCNYDRVFKRADISEKPNVQYQKFNNYSVRLSYTTGLKTKLNKLEILRGGEKLAELDIDFELSASSSGIYWNMAKYELKDGNIVSLEVDESDGSKKLHFYHCTENFIKEIKLYDINGNEASVISSGPNNSETDNVLLIFDPYGDSLPKRFEVDFANSVAKQFYKYPLEKDESEMPNFADAVYDTKMLEEVFYGEWVKEFENWDDVNPGGGYRIHYDPLVFSYTGRCIDYPNSNIANTMLENEKGWFVIGRNGGAPQICFVPKDDPDTLYYYQDTTYYMNNFDKVYKRTEKTVAIDEITAPAQLTPMGVKKLAETTGFDILNPPESVNYDNAKKWVMGEIRHEGIGEIYLVSLSENKIVYCRRAYPMDNAPEVYIDGVSIDYDGFVYLTFTAEKVNGEWKMSSASDKNGKELYNLLESLDADVSEAVADFVLTNYNSNLFWDESLNPYTQRITADAVKKFNSHIAAMNDEDADMILSDDQLVYSMCINTYWTN